MLTGKTSTTAYVVVAGLANLARIPRWRGYFADDAIRLNNFFLDRVRDTLAKRLIGCLSPQLFIKVMDTFYIPGMTEHFLFRKKLVEGRVEAAISDGIRQVIVMGAGLDMLAPRSAEKHPGVNFFEIDLPGTQRTKLQMLKEYGYVSPSNCTFKEADLAQSKLEMALFGESRFDPDAPSLVVLEGVLMYLSESEVKSLFSTMRRLFRGQLMVVFGAIAASDKDAGFKVKIMNALLNRGREGTKWHCASADMPKFMGDIGYEIISWLPYKNLQKIYRSESEIVALPEEDENYYAVAKMPQTRRDQPIKPITETSFIAVKG